MKKLLPIAVLLLTLQFPVSVVQANENEKTQPEKREEFTIRDEFPHSVTTIDNMDTVSQKREVYIIKDVYYNPTRQLDLINEAKTTIEFIGFRSPKKGRSANKQMRGHWSGISLHYSGLVSSLGNLSLPCDARFLSQNFKSIGISLNPFKYTFPLSKRTGFVTGLGLEFNNFRFDENMFLRRENGTLVPDYSFDERGINLKKSKLFTSYINVPLLFEAQFGRGRNFFVNGGVVGGMLMGARTKIKVNHPDVSGRIHKNRGNLGLRNFHYGYTVNMGFDNIALTATYYAGTLFRENQGPEVRQVNIGIAFMIK